jgi:ABC-2 type transport system permease protein
VTSRLALVEEILKLPAFFRRDFLTMWTYRLAFFSDWFNMAVQIFIFSLLGRLIDPSMVPSYGGSQVGYVEFVAVGITVMGFLQVALNRMVAAIRKEQMIGTLEVVLASPTSPATFQIGSVAYDLVYVPIRTVVFLTAVSAILGVDLAVSQFPVAILLLIVFIPFVWGLGEMSAAVTLTFRQGAGVVGLVVTFMTVLSEGYFPIQVFPDFLQGIARLNPLSVTMNGIRSALLGGMGFEDLVGSLLYLVPFSVLSLVAGSISFWLALRRERRNGTLGLY